MPLIGLGILCVSTAWVRKANYRTGATQRAVFSHGTGGAQNRIVLGPKNIRFRAMLVALPCSLWIRRLQTRLAAGFWARSWNPCSLCVPDVEKDDIHPIRNLWSELPHPPLGLSQLLVEVGYRRESRCESPAGRPPPSKRP